MLFITRSPAVGNHTGSRRIRGVEMKRIRVRVLGGAVALLLVSVALTQQPVPRPVATVTQLMQAMMVPARQTCCSTSHGRCPKTPPGGTRSGIML